MCEIIWTQPRPGKTDTGWPFIVAVGLGRQPPGGVEVYNVKTCPVSPYGESGSITVV